MLFTCALCCVQPTARRQPVDRRDGWPPGLSPSRLASGLPSSAPSTSVTWPADPAVRVLLSDGSGLTARQVAAQLFAAGHTVEALSPDRLALTRFTRCVRRVHPVPPYGIDPFAWLDEALAVVAAGHFDVLFPTQEQVAVLARCEHRLRAAGVRTAVPAFDALARVQDKLSARATLAELGLPQPEGAVVASPEELCAWERFPVFVKTPIGTATTGVRHVTDRAEL